MQKGMAEDLQSEHKVSLHQLTVLFEHVFLRRLFEEKSIQLLEVVPQPSDSVLQLADLRAFSLDVLCESDE